MLDSKFEIVSVCEPYHYERIFLRYPAFKHRHKVAISVEKLLYASNVLNLLEHLEISMSNMILKFVT